VDFASVLLKRGNLKLVHLFTAISQLLLIGHAISFLVVSYGVDSVESKMIIAGIYTAIGPTIVFIAPTSNKNAILLAAEHIILGMIGWGHQHPALEDFNWFSLLTIFDSLGLALNVFFYKYLIQFSPLDSRSKELQLQNERLRLEAIETQMHIAQRVQDSLSPALKVLHWNDAEVHFYHEQQDILGGDWMGARILPSGELVLVVADVTGKGIAAAMVAQAINTLWAEAKAASFFAAEDWLRSVNRTLYDMGEKVPHTATVGLAVVGRDQLTYYSCGHTPIFIGQAQRTQNVRYRPVIAPGQVLGLSGDISFNPRRINFAPGAPTPSILLGSDGVFARGSRTSSKKISAILNGIEHERLAPEAPSEAEDDRLLIWVRPASQAGLGTLSA